jgi:hypothetical protein
VDILRLHQELQGVRALRVLVGLVALLGMAAIAASTVLFRKALLVITVVLAVMALRVRWVLQVCLKPIRKIWDLERVM